VPLHEDLHALQAGLHPRCIARAPSGWYLLHEIQAVPGHALLVPDPLVPSLNDLPGPARARFLADMATLGDALLRATGAERINYEILGNVEPVLHAHAVPRYASEPPERRRAPVWFYDMEEAPRFAEPLHGALVRRIAAELGRRSL
jgi:diadenosine tetraphosphate (Ap4A) HIT family hydrolase